MDECDNASDDRGRRERSSIVKSAGSATPVDRVVPQFPRRSSIYLLSASWPKLLITSRSMSALAFDSVTTLVSP